MAIDNDFSGLESISGSSFSLPIDWDFDPFLGDTDWLDAANLWSIPSANDFSGLISPPGITSTPTGTDVSHSAPSSSVTDASFGLGPRDFGADPQRLDMESFSTFRQYGCDSSSTPAISSDIASDFQVSGITGTATSTLVPVGMVSQGEAPKDSQIVITIDEAESDTVMRVMKVLVTSRAAVNFRKV